MDPGEMEIKKIEDSTHRQMAYSKRRKANFKKAHELTLICDAKVAIIMFSSTKKLHEYTSPNSTMKKIIDPYQRTLGVDLWSTHDEKMQEKLRRLIDVNNTLRRDTKQRIGAELNDLNTEQLCSLEDNMLESVEKIRQRKFQVRNLQSMQELLRDDLVTKYEYPHGVVENEGDYDSVSAVAFANEISNLSAMQRCCSGANPRVEGSFELENSCFCSMVTMDVENSL